MRKSQWYAFYLSLKYNNVSLYLSGPQTKVIIDFYDAHHPYSAHNKKAVVELL